MFLSLWLCQIKLDKLFSVKLMNLNLDNLNLLTLLNGAVVSAAGCYGEDSGSYLTLRELFKRTALHVNGDFAKGSPYWGPKEFVQMIIILLNEGGNPKVMFIAFLKKSFGKMILLGKSYNCGERSKIRVFGYF